LLGEVGKNTYQFTHDLIREVVLSDLGTARRAFLYRRVAEVLEATAPATAATVLAYHYAQSDEQEKELALARQQFEAALEICTRLGERLYALPIEQALAKLS
jgi:hypothetical protein